MFSPPLKRGLSSIQLHWREILFLALLVWTLGLSAYRGGTNADSPLTGTDFKVFYQAAQRLNAGQPLYVPPQTYGQGIYVYLPLTAIAMRPLAQLPEFQAFKIWTAVNILLLLGAVALFALASNFRWQDSLLIGIILLLSFRFWPTSYTLALGQLNFVILFLLAAMYYAQSQGKWLWFGMLIVLAAFVKTWMIGFVLYLILMRQWRAALGSVVSLTILAVLAFCIVGWQELPQFIHSTSAYSSQPWIVSQSLAGFARLHFAPNMHMQPLVNSQAVKLAFIATGYLILTGAFWQVFHRPVEEKQSPPVLLNLQLGFFTLSFLLALPLCHMDYFIFALPLFWTILTWNRKTIPLPLWIPLGALCVYILFTRPWPISGEALKAFDEGIKTLIPSFYFLGACCLWWSACRRWSRPGWCC